jgi:hypothetical protein
MLGNNGYKPFSMNGKLDDFKNSISAGTGVFFTSTHGARWQGMDKKQHFYLLTTQRYNPQDESGPIGQDLKNGLLGLGSEMENGHQVPVLCIGAGFVTKYMKFGPNSLWINGACQSFDQEFYQACFAKGLSAYAGWTESVERGASTRASKYIFDRLLGANADEEYPAAPPQRPFDLIDVLQALARTPGANTITNPTLDQSNWIEGDPTWKFPFIGIPGIKVITAKLQYAFAAGPPTPAQWVRLLAPSITQLTVDEVTNKLAIQGSFGSDSQGATVTVGGSALTIVPGSWRSDEIQCSGLAPGLTGDVVVTVKGHKSNAVPLTLWKGQLHLKVEFLNQQTEKYDVNWILTFRGDAHGFRSFPDQPVFYPTVPGGPEGAPTIRIQNTGRDSVVNYTATGTDDEQMQRVDISGSGSIPYSTINPYPGSTDAPGGYTASMDLDVLGHKMYIRADAAMWKGIGVVLTFKGTNPTTINSTTDLATRGDGDNRYFDRVNTSTYLTLAMDSNLNGAGSQKVFTQNNVRYTYTWTAFTAKNAPTPMTSRAK